MVYIDHRQLIKEKLEPWVPHFSRFLREVGRAAIDVGPEPEIQKAKAHGFGPALHAKGAKSARRSLRPPFPSVLIAFRD